MILVRNIFQIHPEQMREAKAAVKEMIALEQSTYGALSQRILSDLTGDFYALVLETGFESLADVDLQLSRFGTDQNWRAAYARLRKTMVGGRREIFRVED